jgi:hypothetical protein
MQPNYLERVKNNRDNTSQAAAHDGEQAAMLAELKKMQMAALIGSQGKSTVILTDQTDLGDKLESAIKSIETAIKGLDSADTDAEQLAALKKLQGIFDGYFKRVGSDTASIVAAIKSLDISPVIEAPVVNVPAPVVHSPAVDLTGVEQAIERAMTPVDVEASTPDRCDLSRYRAQDLYESGDMQYVGFVNPEGNWYIIENDISKNRMRYVFGMSGYARHFRAAATYEYKLLDKAYSATA